MKKYLQVATKHVQERERESKATSASPATAATRVGSVKDDLRSGADISGSAPPSPPTYLGTSPSNPGPVFGMSEGEERSSPTQSTNSSKLSPGRLSSLYATPVNAFWGGVERLLDSVLPASILQREPSGVGQGRGDPLAESSFFLISGNEDSPTGDRNVNAPPKPHLYPIPSLSKYLSVEGTTSESDGNFGSVESSRYMGESYMETGASSVLGMDELENLDRDELVREVRRLRAENWNMLSILQDRDQVRQENDVLKRSIVFFKEEVKKKAMASNLPGSASDMGVGDWKLGAGSLKVPGKSHGVLSSSASSYRGQRGESRALSNEQVIQEQNEIIRSLERQVELQKQMIKDHEAKIADYNKKWDVLRRSAREKAKMKTTASAAHAETSESS